MNKILLIMFSVLTIFSYAVSSLGAEDAGEFQEESGDKTYKIPVIAPEIYSYGGYGIVHFSGSELVEEYEYLHDSILLGGELRLLEFPHRAHLDIDLKNRKDYSGDISYAYKDIIVFRGVNTTLFHNLDNIRLIDMNTGTANPGVNIMDMGDRYGTKISMNNIFLRLKTPEFPFHVYFKGNIIDKNGKQQQRNLLGSAYFNPNVIRASQQRDVDWQTRNIVIGANSHLGPVEVDISHSEKRFDVSGDNVLFDNYGQTGFGPPPGDREAGVYPHNLIPELKSSTNTLKLHTSYTGKLVASASFSKIDKENRDSGAKADYFIGSGEVTWMPLTKLTFLLKYRHKETDIDNPGTASITNTAATKYIYPVKNSISSVTDRLSAAVRFRPLSGLTLRGDYSYEHIDRKDNDEWEIPETTVKNIMSLSADLRIVKNLKLKAKYTHKDINSPASNIEPDRSDEGKVSLSWMPVPRLNTLVSYSLAREKREDLHYIDTDLADERYVKRDMLLGSATLLVLKDLSVTASYAYMHNRIQQDIEYHDGGGTPSIDSNIPYKDTAHNYALDLNYMPKNNITLAAGVNHTISKGAFYPDDPNLTQPVSIASFSELKTKATIYSASGEYKFKHGFATGIQYRYSTLNDVLDNRYDGVKDGKAQIILLTLSKKW